MIYLLIHSSFNVSWLLWMSSYSSLLHTWSFSTGLKIACTKAYIDSRFASSESSTSPSMCLSSFCPVQVEWIWWYVAFLHISYRIFSSFSHDKQAAAVYGSSKRFGFPVLILICFIFECIIWTWPAQSCFWSCGWVKFCHHESFVSDSMSLKLRK